MLFSTRRLKTVDLWQQLPFFHCLLIAHREVELIRRAHDACGCQPAYVIDGARSCREAYVACSARLEQRLGFTQATRALKPVWALCQHVRALDSHLSQIACVVYRRSQSALVICMCDQLDLMFVRSNV